MFLNTSSNSASQKSRNRRLKVLGLSATSMIIFAGLGISFDRSPSSLSQVANAQVVQAGRNIEIRTNGKSYSFYPGKEWRTPSGYKFVFQRDKNLVLYNRSNRAIWATGSERMDARKFTVQSDGNVVLYNGANRPIWATNTSGNRNAYFAIQDDGNLVVYSSTKRVLWTSNTSGGRSSGIFNAASRWQTPPLHSNPTVSNPLTGFLHPLRWSNMPAFPPKHSSAMGRGPYAYDLPASKGTKVYAMRAGKVKSVVENNTRSACNSSYGQYNNYVLLEHDNGYRSLYLHLDTNSVPVNVGDSVSAGQLIGRSGNIGYVCGSTGEHLHVEVNKSGSSVYTQTQPFKMKSW